MQLHRELNKYVMGVLSDSAVRRKFSWGSHSVAYRGHLYLVCVVCDVTIGRHIPVSKQTF